MRVLRADDTGELELSGTVADLLRLARVLRLDRGRCQLDTAGDPSPYSRALGSLESTRENGKLVITVSANLESLQLAGERDALESLASVLEEFATEGDISTHVHLEYLPGHHYLSPQSEPLVIALTG
jgi:hypothetical protein